MEKIEHDNIPAIIEDILLDEKKEFYKTVDLIHEKYKKKLNKALAKYNPVKAVEA